MAVHLSTRIDHRVGVAELDKTTTGMGQDQRIFQNGTKSFKKTAKCLRGDGVGINTTDKQSTVWRVLMTSTVAPSHDALAGSAVGRFAHALA
jgi:hypothetical protein